VPGTLDEGPARLERVIGFWGGTALIIGVTIGSGIFRKPPTIAGLVPDPLVIMGLWVLFGVISMCGALALAELSSMLPRVGGVYVFLREAFGNGAAFVFGWILLLVTAPASIAALATVFVEFLLGALRIPADSVPVPAIAVAIIVVLSIVNVVGTRLGAAVQAVFTVIKVSALGAIILASFAAGGGSVANLTTGTGAADGTGIARAMASVIWTYDGWIAVSMIAGEVVAPERLLRRIIIAGMTAIVVLYLGANLAYHYMMPVDVMATQKAAVAVRVMTDVVGSAGGAVIGFCIVGSVLGALSGNVLAKPRVSYAMAKDGLAFRVLGHSHPRFGTPDLAIAAQAGVAILLVLVLRDFDKLTTYFIVVEWFALIFAVAAVFVLRRKLPDAPRPFRTPGYPWVPLVFVAGTFAGLAAIVWGEWQARNYSPLVGLAIAAAGFPIYALTSRRRAAAAAAGS